MTPEKDETEGLQLVMVGLVILILVILYGLQSVRVIHETRVCLRYGQPIPCELVEAQTTPLIVRALENITMPELRIGNLSLEAK